RAALAGFEEPIRLPKETLSVVVRNGFVRVDQRVDLRHQDRERPQPGEVFVVEQQLQKLARPDGPVPVFVGTTLPVHQERVESDESGTEFTQAFTIVVHDSRCTPGALLRHTDGSDMMARSG